jgi:hypothetical protein
MYNVLALSFDLPQMSDKTVSSVNIILEINSAGGTQNFMGNIIALSDRINSVLVPASFMEWSNLHFAGVSKVNPSRIYLKTKDANNPQLISFLESKNYHLNKDKTKFGRVKQVLQGIFSALGIFGLLVVVLALMLFSFYLQLVIARSKDNLRLLITLGYSPDWLSKNVSKQFIPVYVGIVLAAMAITAIIQWLFHRFAMYQRPEISSFIHWSIIALAAALITLSVFTNYRLVRKLLYKMF